MIEELVLFTMKGCHKCNKLKSILDSKNISYVIESNMDEIVEVARTINSTEMPILKVDSKLFSGDKAIEYGENL